MEEQSGDSPNSSPWELPVKLERVNMTTVGVTRGLWPLEQPPSALPLSDRSPLLVVAGHTADAVALHTERATACRNSLDTF